MAFGLSLWLLASACGFWLQPGAFGFSLWLLASACGFWLQPVAFGFSLWLLASACGFVLAHCFFLPSFFFFFFLNLLAYSAVYSRLSLSLSVFEMTDMLCLAVDPLPPLDPQISYVLDVLLWYLNGGCEVLCVCVCVCECVQSCVCVCVCVHACMRGCFQV